MIGHHDLVPVCFIIGTISGLVCLGLMNMDEFKKAIIPGIVCFVCLVYFIGLSINDLIASTTYAAVGSPIVEETRYEILGGTDTTRVSGSISGGVFYETGSASEENLYKIYYSSTNSDGEDIVVPKTVKESQTEIVFLPDEAQDEYLLKIITKQRYGYKDIMGDKQLVKTESVKYKLYVTRETFNNKVVIDRN